MKMHGIVPLKFPEKEPERPAESFLSTWLGLPSIALGLFSLVLVCSANLGRPIGPRDMVQQEGSFGREVGATGVLPSSQQVRYFALSSNGWLCIAIGSALGFLGAAERKGRSRLSLAGLWLNFLACVVSWSAIFGFLA